MICSPQIAGAADNALLMKSKKPKTSLIIIDGHAMAYRAHFAFAGQNLTDAQGNATETVFGFFRMVARLIADRKPTHVALCFDPGREHNPRYELFPDYKANRPPMPDELRRQIDDVQQIAKDLHLPPLIIEGAEADDTIASLIEQHRDEFDHIEIVSGDKDLYNMLYKNVVMLRSKKGVTEFEEVDEAWVKNKIGVTREQIPDYMALVGDTADNVPGVKGVGEKTAAKLIADYKSLDKIYKNIEKVKPDGLRAKLEASRDNAYTSQTLVTLRKDIALPVKPADLVLNLSPDGANLFRKRGFNTVASEWEKILKGGAVAEGKAAPAAEIPVRNFCQNTITVKTVAELEKLLQRLSKFDQVCVDTETTGLEIHDSEIFGVSFGWFEGKALHSAYVALPNGGEASLNGDYADADAAAAMLQPLKKFLENKKAQKIGQNIKFDLQVFRRAGIEVQNYTDDTMLLSYLINPNVRRHNMDDLAEDYLQYKTVSFDELVGKGKNRMPIGTVPLDRLSHYACEDAEVTLALRDALLPKVESMQLVQVYHEIDVPLAKVLADIEYTGICIDAAHLAELAKVYKKKIAAAEKQIYKHAGEEFNIASTKQLQTILFEKLQIASSRKTEKGAMSTDQSVLEELKDAHPVIAPILEYRFYTKLLSTYVEALPGHVSKTTGRVHTSLSQVTAATGRLSSIDPNLQNIPVKGEEGANLRAAFVAAKGRKLLSLDYSQIELRILAHVSEDANLIAAYKNDEDIHDRAAYMLFRSRFNPKSGKFDGPGREVVFDVDQADLKKMKAIGEFAEFRSQAKVLNFSIVYGVTEFGLARNLSITRGEAKELMANYFAAFPGIKIYMQKVIDSAREKGYAENLFGRRRPLGDLKNANRFVREAAERLAINTPVQSTAADLIKKAMISIEREILNAKLESRMVLQIHDELLFEVAPGEEARLEKLAKHEMENVLKLKVPLKTSGAFGRNWNECKG
ncbi:DNA polymerase I [Turneriella parva DSM 21527]|uniref:DNA polymerase I n=2 Tax=Turneriella TaxID=338321 RepID=I4B7P0_TURPD|nr:DNA polymerase I [Turneriella parva DSM 21527]